MVLGLGRILERGRSSKSKPPEEAIDVKRKVGLPLDRLHSCVLM